MGYPNVYAGHWFPRFTRTRAFLICPSSGSENPWTKIVGFRSTLVRGEHRVHVNKFEESGKIIDRTRELALSVCPVDVELALKDRPHRRLVLDDQIQPLRSLRPHFGYAGRKFKVGSPNRKGIQGHRPKKRRKRSRPFMIEECWFRGYSAHFSVGASVSNLEGSLVPTRWSITAVDSILSRDLMKEVRTFPEINEYQVYDSSYFGQPV